MIDLTGKKFNRLVVVGFSHRNAKSQAFWSCVCDCGNKAVVQGYKLSSGHTKSCGCYKIEQTKKANFTDLAGMKFGTVTVIRHAGQNKHTHHLWQCECECGNKPIIETGGLKTLKGCDECSRGTHKMSNTTTHNIWIGIRARCNNPNDTGYSYYGGRGIKVCKRWDSFENFLADMGERPDDLTIDRKDNDGDYSPDNCQWATRKEQCANKRVYRGIPIEYNGVCLSISQWADITRTPYHTIWSRLSRGWSIRRSLGI